MLTSNIKFKNFKIAKKNIKKFFLKKNGLIK